MFLTDETMDEFAQWQHDSAWEFEDDEFEIREGDMFECIHELDNGEVIWEDNGLPGRYFRAWPVFYCDCGEAFELKGN